MAITARLSHKLRETLGDEAAEDMVGWMHQVDTQRAELRELNELNFSRFDARMAEARAEVDAKLADVRQEMRSGFAEVRQEMRVGFAELRQEMSRVRADLMKWSLVFWVGSVGAIAALAGVLR